MIPIYSVIAPLCIIVVGSVIRKKSSDMPFSQQQLTSSPSRSSANLRMVALSAISFFIGLQFKNVKDLFGSGDIHANSDAAWAPDNFGRQQQLAIRPKETLENTRGEQEQLARPKKDSAANFARERRINPNRAKAGKPEVEKEDSTNNGNKKKKKKGKPRLFEMSNYTQDFEPLPWSLPKPTPMRYQTSEEFMADYIAAKKKHKIPLPWEQKDKYAKAKVTLPLPIVSLNFPKSATLTMKSYFDCGGLTAVHTSTQDGRIAVCMMENQLADRPPMDRCNTHNPRDATTPRDSVVPIDFISDIGTQGPPCYYSSLHDGGLENIAKHNPEGTILLVTRNATSWHKSMSKWGTIMHRWRKYCHFDGSMHRGNEPNINYWKDMYGSPSAKRNNQEEYWVNFYQSHTQKIREFAMKHLSMTYIEVELENKNMGAILEKYTSIKPSCIMDCHPGPKWVKLNNATSRCHPVGKNPALMTSEERAASMNVEEEGDEEEEERDNEESNDDGDNTESGDTSGNDNSDGEVEESEE